jgi:hypothetical protein
MTRVLSELLGAEEPMFGIALRQLEKASGNMGVDVRLTTDIIAKAHAAHRALGLDPQDTTGRELYHALLGMVARHDDFLARRLGATDSEDVADILQRVRIASQNAHIPRKGWFLKHSVAKRLLKATPPRQVMRALHYRSVDSMIKREPVGELMIAIRVLESQKWQHAFLAKYSKLKPIDFEVRDIEVVYLNDERWCGFTEQFVRANHHNLTHLKEMGVIALLPLPIARLRGIAVTVLPLVLHYINEIRLYSAFFKLQQVNADFGDTLVETLTIDPSERINIAGQPLHWRVVHRHFGKYTEMLPEMFEPHVRLEDLEWRKAETVLYELEPALHFWHDMDYVGSLYDAQPVSFNLMDMAANYVNNLPYDRRAVGRMRQSLWSELCQRYVAQPMFERQVLRQLDADRNKADLFMLSYSDKL